MFRSEVLDWLDEIEAEVLTWKGTSISMHKYGGIQFNYNGREIGHLHSNGILDVLYSRKIKAQLLADGRIEPHHVFTDSGWISFYLASPDDKEYAIQLLLFSYLRTRGERAWTQLGPNLDATWTCLEGT